MAEDNAKERDGEELLGRLDSSIMGERRGGVSTRLLQSRPCDAGFKETHEGWRSGALPLQAQKCGHKEVCDGGMLEQRRREGGRRGRQDEMKGGIEEEAASPNFPWQVPSSSAADNGELIIWRSQFASIH